ncbi:MAG: ATP-dependent helicase [Desulfurococcales archaeon]|nr:ATP-dependent helicase [Desulfurococcales archaeon]
MGYSDEEVYKLLRPYVAKWFKTRYGSFTLPQKEAIPLVKAGHNVLVSSPTGTGKTLAAFLGIIDELFKTWEEGELEDKVYAIYVSPLRALNNDMRRNLVDPLNGIYKVLEDHGLERPEIRIAVRTSDTSSQEKQRMLKRPPHILITTPESLAISLSAPKFRERLSTARWIILDEIHEVAQSKRGAHLMLSVERLQHLVESRGGRLARIGMSATISPLEVVARFLGGYDNGRPRPVKIVDARFAKPIDIRVIAPEVDLVHAPADEINESIYRKLVELVRMHNTTLIFTNTRSATERVVYKLKKLLKEELGWSEDLIEAHHSSLSRSLRLDVEERLKRGELRVVVSSTSLELGIDIGYIDLVVLLSSPKSVSRLLQRIGRAGHHIRQVSKGRVVVVDRDDLVECSVLVKSAMERFIDSVRIPMNPLDVLAQHLVGMAVESKWRIDDAYNLVRRAYNFHNLDYNDFIRVLRYLAGRDGLEEERVYAKIWLDEDEGVFGRRGGARMIYQLNAGTIPDESKIEVYTVNGKYVGNLEEEFVEILAPGDIFVLGGRTYRFIRSTGLKIIVEDAEGARPTVPSWFSEMLPLSFDSALRVGRFRRRLSKLLRVGDHRSVNRMLMEEYMLEKHSADAIRTYIWEELAYLGEVPGDDLIVVEYFKFEDGWGIVFHTLYGRRVNDALSRGFASILARLVKRPVRVGVSDNGFMLIIDVQPSSALIRKLIEEADPGSFRSIVEEALARTELVKRRFRHVAQRSFMILKRYKGREKSPERMQLSAQKLLEVLMEVDPEHPVVRETYREILEDYMDIGNAVKVLNWIKEGRVRVVVKGPLPYPSPMAHHLVVRGYSDVVLMEDRRRLLALLHDRIMEILSRSGDRVVGGFGSTST